MEPKDWIGVTTGIIGAVAGVTGLIRSIRTERYVYGERYFKVKWISISDRLKAYAAAYTSHLGGLPDLSDPVERLPEIKIDKLSLLKPMNWKHDKNLEHLISKIYLDTAEINESIRDYNDFSYATSQTFVLFTRIHQVSDFSDEEREEHNAAVKKKVDYFEALTQKYLGKTTVNTAELASHPAYINDQKKMLYLLRQQHQALTESIEMLIIKIDEYDTIFSS